MRNILFALILCLMPHLLFAADVRLAWDPMPQGEVWTAVRIYEVTGVAPALTYTLKGEVLASPAGVVPTQITISGVAPGVHTYIARSVAPPWGESVDSNSVVTGPATKPPTGVKVTVVVTVNVN